LASSQNACKYVTASNTVAFTVNENKQTQMIIVAMVTRQHSKINVSESAPWLTLCYQLKYLVNSLRLKD